MPSVQRYPAEFRRERWSWPNTAGGPQGALKGTQRQRDDDGSSSNTPRALLTHADRGGRTAPTRMRPTPQEREILKKALALYAGRHSFGESVRNSRGIQAPWHDSRRCVQAAPRLQERLLCVAQSEAREADKREQGSLGVHPWDPPVLRGALQGLLRSPQNPCRTQARTRDDVYEKRVRRLMRQMGLYGTQPKSKRRPPGHSSASCGGRKIAGVRWSVAVPE